MSLKIDGVNNLIKDTNGNEALSLPTTSSAVNYPLLRNSATGVGVSAEAQGDDSNIDFLVTPKGTGKMCPGGPVVMQTGVAPSQGRASLAMTDANYTLANTEYNNRILEVPSSLTLTAGRNAVLPTTDGAWWIAFNNSTGGFAVTFKTNAGSGIAVAAGKRAILYCDGTNIVRVTADT